MLYNTCAHIRGSKPFSTNFLPAVKVDGFNYSEFCYDATSTEKRLVKTSCVEIFYFIRCSEGEISLTLNSESKTHMSPFQSALIYAKAGEYLKIDWKQGGTTKFCVVEASLPRSYHSTSSYFNRYKNIFFNMVSDHTCIFIEKLHPKIEEKLNSLSRLLRQNPTSEFIIEGMILQLLGFKIEQLLHTVGEGKDEFRTLDKDDMQKVHKIADLIRRHPEQDYDEKFICRQCGLSILQLQEGFKNLYNTTLTEFLLNVRLEKAGELMRTTDLKLSEIAYRVGWASRSYFYEIFKEKYHCSPNFFQEQHRNGKK